MPRSQWDFTEYLRRGSPGQNRITNPIYNPYPLLYSDVPSVKILIRRDLMFSKSLTIALLIFSTALSPVASFADEGMWMPDSIGKLPLGEMKKRGFELKPEDVYSLTKPSLKDAIVQISIGGTGSFVSPDGLILTNHHVAFAAVTRASSSEKDYINNGFLAKSRAEEIQAKDYTISITQDFKDVTAEVLSAVKPEMSPEERMRAIAAKQQDLNRANSRDKEGIRAQVVEAWGGYQYFRYSYLIR